MSNRYDDDDDDVSSQDFEAEMTVGPTPLDRAMEDHSEGDLETSQLPAIEEYKSQVAASRARANQVLARESHSPRSLYTQSKKKKKEYMIIGAIVAVIIILSVSIGVSVGEKKSSSGYSPTDPYGGDFGEYTNAPTNPPTHMFDSQTLQVVDFVTNKGWSDAAEARKQSSPQFRAANWIADYDPLNLDVDDTLDFRQRYALAVFYYALDGDNWMYGDKLSWLSANNVCDWRTQFVVGEEVGSWIQIGVKCHGGAEVKEIVLPNGNLRGELPRELGLLTGMEGLILWENDLTGSFPSALQKLTLLKEIDFHVNFFDGSMLPEWLGDLSQLTTLNLAQTGITGELPDMSGLSILDTINIGFNSIRDDVGKFAPLSNIRNLIAANNSFYGDLQSDYLFDWPLLEIIDMSNNDISGSLPGNMFSLSHLEVIDLSSNSITGTLPNVVLPNSRMALLALQNNQLYGDFDAIMTHMTDLVHLDLSYNKFVGTMPDDWSNVARLRYLFLAYNDFVSGSIPESLTQATSLVDFSLQATKRQGGIPSGFGQASSLRLLDFSFNRLSGAIPSDIGDATNLQLLFLNQNNMTGEVPSSLASLSQLRSLLLDHNEFSSMPSKICDSVDLGFDQLEYFIADCGEIDCPTSCCTECCTDVNPGDTDAFGKPLNDTCNALPWFESLDLRVEALDPISEYEYRRGVYQFHDNDIRFPTLEPAPTAATQSPTQAPGPTVTYSPTRAS